MAIAPMSSHHIPSVVGAFVFGSYGRGDYDEKSDLDLLVIVRDGSGTTSEERLIEIFHPRLPKRPSISFYGERKLQALFEEGNLFAWHLFLESKNLPGFEFSRQIFDEPNPYITAREDIFGLIRILDGVPKKNKDIPENAVFEMGMLYVCARNIAMSASGYLSDSLKFGRYAPFEMSGLPFPLSKELYEMTMHCRMASTRGEDPPRANSRLVNEISSDLNDWARSVLNQVSSS